MGGFFWCSIKTRLCTGNFFTAWITHSHLGTRRGGMATHGEEGFNRAIHNIEILRSRTQV